MTEVFAKAGPLAGQRVEVPDDEVDAATGKDGWAIKLEEGAVLEIDPALPFNKKWKIPGYEQAEDPAAVEDDKTSKK